MDWYTWLARLLEGVCKQQESQSHEGGKSEKQTEECKREQQQHEGDGKVENNKEEVKGERRTHTGKKKEEKQNSETEQGNKKVNVCQDKMPHNFNQRGKKLRVEIKPARNISVRMTLEKRNANPMAQPDKKSKWGIVEVKSIVN